MTCSACGTENAERAKFCIECGAHLAAVCPTCSEPIVVTARFCANCGTSLTQSGGSAGDRRPTAVAERRVCSILFCDLVGFTPIAEARDPEVVRELLSRYFETARLVIGRYGGTVEKFIGDAVMAVWGAPIATEDDAERAVRAALELVDAVDALAGPAGVPGLAARAGVVTGEVAVTVGAVGEGMVAGDPVNTAARVQTAAAVGEVLMDDTTARLVRAAIEVEDAGARALKGKAQGQQLWRAVRVLANVGGVQRIDGLEAPLIGRDLELRLLKDLFHTTVARSSSRLALVTGEAGSGKSRLGWEFEKYVDGLSDAVWWHRSRCLSYGDGVAFWALTEMVRQRLGIAEEDSPDIALPLLLEGLDRFLPAADERGYVGVRLGRLLGVRHPDDDGRSLEQSELFAGWRTWLVRLADSAPMVWVIEDLQFADSGLLDFLDHLLDWTRTARIHLVGLARPDIEDVQPGWTRGRNRQQIGLEPLDDISMALLLDALVPGMPGHVVTAVSAQAHGVPLFAVETVRSLIDEDLVVPIDGRYRLVGEVGTLAVPETLRAVLAARLDHLAPPLRDLLATAGVLGTSFPAEALASVADREAQSVRDDLTQLVARGLITVGADPLSPERGSYASRTTCCVGWPSRRCHAGTAVLGTSELRSTCVPRSRMPARRSPM